jgi:hypothetical protein
VSEFVRNGGTAVFWSDGANSAITALQLPVRNVLQGIPRQQFFTGISIMRVLTDTTHPVMSGMAPRADVVMNGTGVYSTLAGFDGSVIAKYPSDTTPLRSGFLNGEKTMKGYAAALDVKQGRGHVLLFGFHPQWRGQPMGTFRTVFNSLFFTGAVASNARGAAGFWVAPAH